jgi:hypothetical protein
MMTPAQVPVQAPLLPPDTMAALAGAAAGGDAQSLALYTQMMTGVHTGCWRAPAGINASLTTALCGGCGHMQGEGGGPQASAPSEPASSLDTHNRSSISRRKAAAPHRASFL